MGVDWEGGMVDEPTTLRDGAKCIRLTVMLGGMLEELREVEDSTHLRSVLAEVYRRVQREVDTTLPEHLEAELHRLSSTPADTASIAEQRVAQAQLVGWMEGLMASMLVTVSAAPDADGRRPAQP